MGLNKQKYSKLKFVFPHALSFGFSKFSFPLFFPSFISTTVLKFQRSDIALTPIQATPTLQCIVKYPSLTFSDLFLNHDNVRFDFCLIIEVSKKSEMSRRY